MRAGDTADSAGSSDMLDPEEETDLLSKRLDAGVKLSAEQVQNEWQGACFPYFTRDAEGKSGLELDLGGQAWQMMMVMVTNTADESYTTADAFHSSDDEQYSMLAADADITLCSVRTRAPLTPLLLGRGHQRLPRLVALL